MALRHMVLALLPLVGCNGKIGDVPSSSPSTDSMGQGPTGGTGGPSSPAHCGAPQAPAFHALLLSPSQYDHTVQDLLQLAGDPAKDFGGGAFTLLDDLGVERRANAAADLAHQAALSLAKWSPCAPPAVDAATCESQIIDKIGARAFRHPLSAGERTELGALFDAGVKEKDFATGVEWFLTGVLQSPDFLYQLAKPATGEKPGEVHPLAGTELASRLSYFLWDSQPDDALFGAAAAGDLADPAHLRTHLDRMLQDPRFSNGITGFYTTWLRLDGFREVARDDTAFNTDVVNALQTSLLSSATQLYATGTANVSQLFSGQTYYLNGALRAFYGLGTSGADFAPVEIAGEDRRGILTHPALMALLARPNSSNPIARGLFVRRTVMCQEIPPPPAGVTIPQLPPIAPGLSTRDRLDQHAKAPLCATCHDQIDPPGFALESFDQVGRHRTVDSGKAVDTSGTMSNGGDLDGPFAKGDDLLVKIAASSDVKTCFAHKYFEYATSRPIANEDQCSVDALAESFAPSGDLRELVVSIASSDSFRFRLSEGDAP